MTLQQMEYIVALNKYRHFVLAAESCGITQPTLSAMIQKLEDELEVKLFDRSNKSVTPTQIGIKVIQQAQTVINEIHRVKEVIADETDTMKGKLKIGIVPTVAPYIVPDFIYEFRKAYPDVNLNIDEMKSKVVMDEILLGNIDAAIAISGEAENNILEIPLYKENFVLYFSENCAKAIGDISPDILSEEHMWILKEGHCIKDAAFSFCKSRAVGHHIYEAGTIDTLIKIVDKNGGYTIIPELHKNFLSTQQLKQIRPIQGVTATTRSISMYIKNDYIRERMLNAIGDTIKKIIPANMIDAHLMKFGVKL